MNPVQVDAKVTGTTESAWGIVGSQIYETGKRWPGFTGPKLRILQR